jgi:hypothetical protein
MQELARTRDGRQGLNYAIYHDRYQRTADGWKFTERVYEVRYFDTSPLAGPAPHPAAAPADPPAGNMPPRKDDGDQLTPQPPPQNTRIGTPPCARRHGPAAIQNGGYWRGLLLTVSYVRDRRRRRCAGAASACETST